MPGRPARSGRLRHGPRGRAGPEGAAARRGRPPEALSRAAIAATLQRALAGTEKPEAVGA